METQEIQYSESHMLNLGDTNGEEYILAGATIYDYLDKLPNLISTEKLNQLEFSEFGPNHCTDYGAMHALIPVIGRELTPDERWEILTRREKTDPEFNRNSGGYTFKGIDNIRQWWNEKNPNDTVISFAVPNKSKIRTDLLSKNYPLSNSFYGNGNYNNDSKDGVLENISFGTFTYGHCVGNTALTVNDNYNNQYRFKDERTFIDLVSNGTLHNYSYIFVKESWLTQRGENVVKMMKAKAYNGERANEKATAFETSAMLKKLLGFPENNKFYRKHFAILVQERFGVTGIWNEQDPFAIATIEQEALMIHRAILNNQNLQELILTREEVAEGIGKTI